MSRLEGKIAVVTGGNSGIGLATAKAYQEEGAKVAIFGRNEETLDEAAGELGNGAVAVQGDVTDPEALDRLFATTVDRLGKIDVLFVNAGIAPFQPFADTDEGTFDRIFDINVKGAFYTVQKALPHLADGASIIFNSSCVTQLGLPNSAAYAASKAAVRSLARTLSAELLERGIRVNSLSPGPIETPIYDRMGLPDDALEEMGKQITSQVPLGRFGKPEEIASAAVFLASADSSYIVGTDLIVDGGMTQI